MWNRKLIQFHDGTWGVRSGYWFFSFKSFITDSTWWGAGSICFNHCKTTEKQARAYMNHDKYKVING